MPAKVLYCWNTSLLRCRTQGQKASPPVAGMRNRAPWFWSCRDPENLSYEASGPQEKERKVFPNQQRKGEISKTAKQRETQSLPVSISCFPQGINRSGHTRHINRSIGSISAKPVKMEGQRIFGEGTDQHSAREGPQSLAITSAKHNLQEAAARFSAHPSGATIEKNGFGPRQVFSPKVGRPRTCLS